MFLSSFNKVGNKMITGTTLTSLTHVTSMVITQQDWTLAAFSTAQKIYNDFEIRILSDLINFRYRKNDYNTGVQLQIANFEKLYPIIYFDLRNTEESVTGDPKQLTLHYKLNQAADAQDYNIFALVFNEEELVLKQIGNELVTV